MVSMPRPSFFRVVGTNLIGFTYYDAHNERITERLTLPEFQRITHEVMNVVQSFLAERHRPADTTTS